MSFHLYHTSDAVSKGTTLNSFSCFIPGIHTVFLNKMFLYVYVFLKVLFQHSYIIVFG